MRRLIVPLALVTALGFVGSPASADEIASVPNSSVAALLQRIGSLPAGAAVSAVDVATASTLTSQRAQVRLMPASTMKLLTAAVALETMGPNFRFSTRVTFDAATNTAYLIGGGDPTLKTSHLKKLADQVVASLGDGAQIALKVDDSLFPAFTRPLGWRNRPVPLEVRPISALSVNDTVTLTPAADAAHLFARLIRARGVKVHYAGRGKSAGDQIASVDGYVLTTILQRMLANSNNNIAETLFRDNSIQAGHSASWTTSRHYATTVLHGLGLSDQEFGIVDGSGLSRRNRLTVHALTQLLTIARSVEHPALNQLLDSHLLAISGQTGTLIDRFRSSRTACAAGLVDAKTGTLKDVSALAGYVRNVNGSVAAFAIVVNQIHSRSALLRVQKSMDWILTGVSGCRD